MKITPGLNVPSSSLVCKLKNSLYGLKQASRQWYSKLSIALKSRGYSHSLNDHSLFIKKTSNTIIIVAVYVDDILVTGNYPKEIQDVKTFLDVAKHVLKYLKGTNIKGILLNNKPSFNLEAFCDSDWAACPITKKIYKWFLNHSWWITSILEIEETNHCVFVINRGRIQVYETCMFRVSLVEQIAC